jgi:hypothetical protein
VVVEIVVEVVVASLVVLCIAARIVIRRRRRKLAEQIYIPTYPMIELEQPYGGWNADAADAYTGHGESRVPLIARVGPPSTWGRVW